MHVTMRQTSRFSVAALLVASLLLSIVGSTTTARAAVSTDSATNVVSVNQQTVKASSSAIPMLGLNLAVSAAETLSSVQVGVSPASGFTTGSLAALTGDGTSGIALYKDNKSGGTAGAFDGTDTFVTLSTSPSFIKPGKIARKTPTAVAPITNTTLTLDAGDLVFAYTTSNSASTGSYGWHIVTTGNSGTGGVASAALRLDGNASAPVFQPGTKLSKLSPNSTGAYTVNGTSNTTSPALTAGDIVFYQTSTQPGRWGIVSNWDATNSGINGSNISNGTYKISKFGASVTAASFVVPSSGAFSASVGNYTSPQVGDLILYQSTSFAQWGIVTDATLTGGVFAVNGTPLSAATYTLAKFAVDETVADNSSSVVFADGDLVFGLTTKNPQSDSANWEIVTTAATDAANPALRFNGSSGAPVYGYNVTLTPSAGQAIPSDDSTGSNVGADYFIVAKTSGSAVNGSSFSMGITRGQITLSTGKDLSGPTATLSSSVSIDTVAPTFLGGSSTPTSGALNVPINTVVNLNFSENIDASTVSSSTAQLTAGGNPVTTTLRLTPSGLSLIPSSAPTYSGTKFATLTTSGFGYFQVGSFGAPIISVGAGYTPGSGDVVIFQRDTFPPEIGIVTNPTLTSGLFSINGLPLYGQVAVSALMRAGAGLTSTGAVTATNPLPVGNLIIANTSDRYAWHIVTAADAVNGAALRLDGGGAQPAFVSGTSYSEVTVYASSTVNGAGNVASLSFNVGDLIYAKAASNADSLGTYGWHIVTAADTLSGAAPGTLRLDDKLSAPTFAANSIISRITPSASGATSFGNTTSFSVGDFMFAKTSAGAGTNGSFVFHLVSQGAVGSINEALRLDNASSPLLNSTVYTVTVGTGITDKAGNGIAAPQTFSFTTGAIGSTSVTPPSVAASTPKNGAQNVAPNAPLNIIFNGYMTSGGSPGSVTNTSNVGLYRSNFGALGSPVATTNSYNSSASRLTLTPGATLATSTEYILRVATTTLSGDGVAIPVEYRATFKTAAANDATAPTIVAAFPQSGATGISTTIGGISVGFSEDLDPTTIGGTSNVRLAKTTGGDVPGGVTYDPATRLITFAPQQALDTNTSYTLTITTGVTDTAGNALASQYTTAFTTTASADVTLPVVTSATADNNAIAVTFSKAMKATGSPNSADNISNFQLESPVGTTYSLAGKNVSYDGPTMTAKIFGLSLQNGSTFKLTAGNFIQDIAGNFMSTSSNANVAFGTVLSSTSTTGGVGTSQPQSSALQGMSPVRVTPTNRLAGAATAYGIEFPVTTAIPLGGSIVLTFPVGFDLTNAVALSSSASPRNSDINGPGAGAVTIASVTPNAGSRTITIVTAGASTGANAFITLDLGGIVNTTIPNTSGYTVDVKTRDTAGSNYALIESKTSAPFFLGAAGAYTLTMNVFEDNGAGGGTAGNNTKDGTEAGIQSARLFLYSPATGSSSSTTDVSGQATFTNLAAGTYTIGIDPSSVVSGGYAVNSVPQQVTITGDASKNYGLQGSSYTISGTITGSAGTAVDVFASSPSGFVKKTVTVGGGGTVSYSLPANANTTYSVGVGPALPTGSTDPGAPPPSPTTFTFMPPPNIQVSVTSANVTGKNFTLTSASKTITGSVLDASGNPIANAGVFARPVATSTMSSAAGFGTSAQTDTSGVFTLNVTPGTYLVGVFKAGMPSSQDLQINVPTVGSNSPTSLTFKLGTSASVTITGTIKDDSGNAIPYAAVNAAKIVSTSDDTIVGGNGSNFVNGPADANGAYTLYVSAGTWKIQAFAPGFGLLGSKTVTVDSSGLTGQDFSAETLSLGTITGTATNGGTAAQGVIVRAEGSAGANMAVTDASGAYSLKVPAGTYSVKCVFPTIGEMTPLTSVSVTADTTTSGQDCAATSPITVTVNVTDGTNPITDAYVDVRDSNGRGNGTRTGIASGANGVYTVTVPAGTYTVRVGHPLYGIIGTTASVNTTRAVSYTATAGSVVTMTGSVKSGGVGVDSAWVQFNGTPTGQTNGIQIGTQTDSDGAYSISIPKGNYQVRANKPGYVGSAPRTVTITTGAALADMTLGTAARTISGTVQISGSGVSGAYVDASNGSGGFAVAQSDGTGAFSLTVADGTWTLHARSSGYESSNSSVTVSGSDVAGQTISLSAISGYTQTAEKQENVTPSAGGLLTNTDIGSGFKVNIPANALGTGSSAGTVRTQANTAVPNPVSGTVLSKNAVTISAVDSGGSPVKNLNDEVTIVIPYTESDIPAGTAESSLVVGVWNSATQTYDSLPTTVDTVNNTLTARTSHFSDFAPLVAASVSVASESSTVLTSFGHTQTPDPTPVVTAQPVVVVKPPVVIAKVDTTTSSTPATSTPVVPAPVVIITPAPVVVPPPAVPEVVYKFKRTIVIGSNGADVTTLQTFLEGKGFLVMPKGIKKGLFGATTSKALKAYQKSVGLKQTGTLDVATRAKINTPPPAAPVVEAPAPVGIQTLKKTLVIGSTGDAVTLLQTFLEDGGFLVMPQGVNKGKFGATTAKALKAYQKSVGLRQTGTVDAKTLKYLQTH